MEVLVEWIKGGHGSSSEETIEFGLWPQRESCGNS